MGRFGWALAVIVAFVCPGCSSSPPAAAPKSPAKWSTGFWLWNEYGSDGVESAPSVDVLYVLAGSLRYETWGPRKGQPVASSNLPAYLPRASEYWLVFRYDDGGLPGSNAVPALARAIAGAHEAAVQRGIEVTGVQLDIDSPTAKLADYALFLKEARKELPAGFELSITALLDWFRKGSDIAEVIEQVDEFVPQFYDLEGPSKRDSLIAAPFDAEKWGPVFGSFGKRYRIGIATFGRARLMPADTRQGHYSRLWSSDVTPLQVGANGRFALEASRNPSNELLLSYRATAARSIGYQSFDAGDVIQFILPTRETIEAAVHGARTLPAPFAGVVFFRWASPFETLAMRPEDVLEAAGEGSAAPPHPNVETADGECVAVTCVDLHFRDARPLSPTPIRYRIRSSAELEYFLPEEGVPVRMVGPSDLELTLPPYGSIGRLHLGRAVTTNPAEYTVEEP